MNNDLPVPITRASATFIATILAIVIHELFEPYATLILLIIAIAQVVVLVKYILVNEPAAQS